MNKEITQYLKELIDFLDGNGIIVEDWDEVMEHLKMSEKAGYNLIKEIILGK